MKIIAHRGASGEFPENTLLAFEHAIKQHADGIELDVQLHPSGELILMHDRYVDSTTNGSGLLTKYSTEALFQLKAKNDNPLATLAPALKHIAGRTLVNIEIKHAETSSENVEALIVILKKELIKATSEYGFQWDQFIVSSFNQHIVLNVKKQIPKVKTAALITGCPIAYAEFTEKLGVYSVNPAIDFVDKNFVEDAHNRGLEVWVYTVDTLEDIQRCQSLGVDAIFTNFPKRSREFVQNQT